MNHIELTSCIMIMQEIDKNGFARVAKNENCIKKIKRVLGIELVENDNGFLIRKL